MLVGRIPIRIPAIKMVQHRSLKIIPYTYVIQKLFFSCCIFYFFTVYTIMRSKNYNLLFCFIFVCKYQSIIKYFNPLHILKGPLFIERCRLRRDIRDIRRRNFSFGQIIRRRTSDTILRRWIRRLVLCQRMIRRPAVPHPDNRFIQN